MSNVVQLPSPSISPSSSSLLLSNWSQVWFSIISVTVWLTSASPLSCKVQEDRSLVFRAFFGGGGYPTAITSVPSIMSIQYRCSIIYIYLHKSINLPSRLDSNRSLNPEAVRESSVTNRTKATLLEVSTLSGMMFPQYLPSKFPVRVK